MLVGSVIHNQIHNDFYSQLMRPGDKHVHVLHSAEHGIDRLVIAYVVTVVVLRRLVNRAEPDNINAQVGKVRQTLNHAAQIAETVAVRILKRARIDLVNYCVCPPGIFGRTVGFQGFRQFWAVKFGHVFLFFELFCGCSACVLMSDFNNTFNNTFNKILNKNRD